MDCGSGLWKLLGSCQIVFSPHTVEALSSNGFVGRFVQKGGGSKRADCILVMRGVFFGVKAHHVRRRSRHLLY